MKKKERIAELERRVAWLEGELLLLRSQINNPPRYYWDKVTCNPFDGGRTRI